MSQSQQQNIKPVLFGFEELVTPDVKAKLETDFIIPPFSILDTRQGYWQDRQNIWKSLGIKSEEGRTAKTFNMGMNAKKGNNWQKEDDLGSGTSIFSPVLCELMYKWFCPKNGTILDPFAGGSVRGITANYLGYKYYGIDLNPEQVMANIEQGKTIIPSNVPVWYNGDSDNINNILPNDFMADFIFSCPPYHDLEQYTDDMDDLSNMSWDTFCKKYASIISKCILKLKENRFACFVVSEIRDEKGYYKGLVPLTIQCFRNAGIRYYNEIILVNVAGTLPVRISGQFVYRKIGHMHQNILVFYKGVTENIPRYFDKIDVNIIRLNTET